MEIKEKLSLVNRTILNNRKIEYIVIHYVGAESSAEANANYFYKTNRSASAHYFVDEKEIWRVVEDKNASWHCGAKHYYNECRNENSIGIEMCCRLNAKGKWYFHKNTVKNTILLVRELMQKYNIPIERVVRHYDVTRKACPEPYVRDEEAWKSFKEMIDVEEIKDIKTALDYLEKKGRMTDRTYWEKAILTTRNIDFLIIKWANDVKKIIE